MGYFDKKKEIEYADYIDEVIGALHRGNAICNKCNAIMTLNKNSEYVCPECHEKTPDYLYKYEGIWSPIWEAIKEHCYVEDGVVYAQSCYRCSNKSCEFPECLEQCDEIFN